MSDSRLGATHLVDNQLTNLTTRVRKITVKYTLLYTNIHNIDNENIGLHTVAMHNHCYLDLLIDLCTYCRQCFPVFQVFSYI